MAAAKKKAAKKPATDAKDRAVMDKAGEQKPKGFMHDKADLDRTDAKTAKLDRALAKAKDACASMAKAIAHAQATDGDDMKMACLDEIGTLGNSIRDAVRKAVREVKTQPQPNVQK